MRTIVTLAVMMLVFRVSLSVSYAEDYKSGVAATVLTKSAVTDNGRTIAYPCTGRAEVTAMTVDIAVGAETGWHSHPIPVYAYVVSGSLSVELENGQVNTYRNGDAIIEVVNTLHNGRNPGPGPVRLAVFYTGIEGTPNVVQPGATLPATIPEPQHYQKLQPPLP